MDLGDLTVTAVVCGLGVSPEGRAAQDQHVHRFTGMRDAVVRRTQERYPWLADALQASAGEYEAADGRGKGQLSTQGRRPG